MRSVEVLVKDRLSALRRDCEVIVDDGVATPLLRKGDGVQSIAALSLAHHTSVSAAREGQTVVLAIEEPEAHLHPKAIHALRDVLHRISADQQIVITTHSPLLVNRNVISSNVIVFKSRAKPARRIGEIRDVLGVQVADNLATAQLVLLVEGESECVALPPILASRSPRLRQCLQDGSLALLGMAGAGNLCAQASILKALLCDVYAFVDNDDAGRRAVGKATQLSLLQDQDVTYAMSKGMPESELEDLLEVTCYEAALRNLTGLQFPTKEFDSRRSKWSDRIESFMRANGRSMDLRIAKAEVAKSAAASPENAWSARDVGVVEGLVAALEDRMRRLTQGS